MVHTDTAEVKSDGWQNALTGLGTQAKDRQMSTTMMRSAILQEGVLNSLYLDDGMAKRIVDLPVHDMVREGFEVEGDTDKIMEKEFRKAKMMTHIVRALKWSRIHGGAAIILGVDDGASDLMQPLNERNIRKIDFVRVFSRWRVNVYSDDLYKDPMLSNYGTPQFYTINPINAWVPTQQYKVHDSRIIIIDGEDIPEQLRQSNQNWGASIYQFGFNRIRGLAEAFMSIDHILAEFVIGVLKVNNLSSLMMSGKEKHIKDRLDMIDLSKHVINSILLDAENEDFSRVASPVTGLQELVNKLIQAISSCYGIPVTLLMGESPAGLGATGASDIRFYYDKIAAEQIDKIQPILERICKIIMLSKEGAFNGVEPKDWTIKFKPLWQPTEKEIADTHNVQANIDKTYIESGVLSPKEVRESRFGGDAYSIDTKLIAGEEPESPLPMGGEQPNQNPNPESASSPVNGEPKTGM